MNTKESYNHQLTDDKQLLIEELKNGNLQAFEEVVARYWNKIYWSVNKLVRNHQDAEEVTQDAFISLQKSIGNFRGEASLSTWLHCIAMNLARNRYWYWRRRKRDQSISIDAPVAESSTATIADLISDPTQDPEREVVTNEFVKRIARAMEQLKRPHRDILIMRNVNNLGYNEIAKHYGINVGTVKSRIARAREALRKKLGEDLGLSHSTRSGSWASS